MITTITLAILVVVFSFSGAVVHSMAFTKKQDGTSVMSTTETNEKSGTTSISVDQAGKKRNRLQNEKSPYLLQHADNPVDWYPWGEEAFDKAQQENKPIFLSIGYSTCHWCHVMEHESFEDQGVADLLNTMFVSIKVDREERPDIDNLYMTVCHMMTQRGGWPLTIIMTPDKRPFFAATYIPKETYYGRIGMMELLPRINDMWQTQREKILTSADQITTYLQMNTSERSDVELGKKLFHDTFQVFSMSFDKQDGGFGSAPKFPSPHNLLFLLRHWKETGNSSALDMVEKTLQAMYYGGVYDHIGFGFHRYSTDAQWLVPHFEKMLYDQAMLAIAYLEAFQATRNNFYAQVAREIFSYVLRDMTSNEGGFYSAEDADSEGEEGKFYVWTLTEMEKVLSPEDVSLIKSVYNMEQDGNFHVEVTGQKNQSNILHLKEPLSTYAEKRDIPEGDLKEKLSNIRTKLFEHREKRIHPLKDDKILTDWNGLMIAAFARGAQILNEPLYADVAKKAADFISRVMMDKGSGTLQHRYREGHVSIPGYLDDYTFYCWGLLELYEATFDTQYLSLALGLTKTMMKNFWDSDQGGLYLTSQNAEKLLVRSKVTYDGPYPAGNSVALLNLLKLARITGDQNLDRQATDLIQAFSGTIQKSPQGATFFVSAVHFAFGPTYEVVIVGDSKQNDTRDMVEAVRKPYVPNKVVLLKMIGDEDRELVRLAPFTKLHSAMDGKATVYVCEQQACRLPTTDQSILKNILTGQRVGPIN